MSFQPWTPHLPPPPPLPAPYHSESLPPPPSSSSANTRSAHSTPASALSASPELTTPSDGPGARPATWGTGLYKWNGGSLENAPPPRRALGEVHQNTPALALASPFSPGVNGVWGPPAPPPGLGSRPLTVEERLAAAEEKIRELTIENHRLKTRTYSNMPPSNGVASPAMSPIFQDHAGLYSASAAGYNRFSDPETFSQLTSMTGDDYSNSPTSGYIPPPYMIASILHGSFNFADMHPEYIRPIVWTVAHRPPKNNAESAGLKAAVNALAARLALPREGEGVDRLVNAIIEWARPLCFTSCGNYLCQQLLERGEVEDKKAFIDKIQEDIVPIASDKFGTHVLCKAIAVKELEDSIAEALLKHGIFDSLKTGARRLWREYLEICRLAKNFDIFQKINEAMEGKWADLACANEHGSIACQQVFEVYGSAELMDPCFREILANISRVANNQFGHFVITKLIGYPSLYRATCDAILLSYPPVAQTHHGINFAKIALTEGGRVSIVKYVDAICSQEDGRTPGIVSIATTSVGKAHLAFVLSCLTPGEHVRVRQVCRSYSTTLRNSQSGNDLLRSLGLIHAIGTRHRGPSSS